MRRTLAALTGQWRMRACAVGAMTPPILFTTFNGVSLGHLSKRFATGFSSVPEGCDEVCGRALIP